MKINFAKPIFVSENQLRFSLLSKEEYMIIVHTNQSAKKPVVIVALVTALCLIGDSMLYIALPIYWKEVGLLSLWEVGLLLSVNRMVRLPLNPLIGWLYSRMSLRTGLLIAVVLATVTTLGYGLAKGLVFWLILRCVWGVAWSLLRLGGFFTVINCAEDHNRGHFMGTYNGLYRLGSLFGMLVGGLLVGMVGLQFVALLFGAIALLGIPLVFLYVKPEEQAARSNQHQSFGAPGNGGAQDDEQEKPAGTGLGSTWLTKPILKIIISGLLLALIFEGVLTSTLSYVIGHHYEEGILLFGIALGVTTLAGIIQAARWTLEPFLATRIGLWSDGPKGRQPLFIVFLLVAAVGFAMIPFALPLYTWLIAIVFVMLCATSLTTLKDALASDVAKKTSAITVMTVYSVALDLGAALGPFLSYLLIRMEYGLFYVYIGASCILLCIAFVWQFSSHSINKTNGKDVTTSGI
jgi:MFS family permease